MLKEKPQPNNPDSPALEMAKQSLREAKELNLSAEQKQEIMSRIKEAKSLEKSNPGQALKIYNELKKYLKDLKLAVRIDKYDDSELRKRQLQEITAQIAKLGKPGFFSPLRKRKKYLEIQATAIAKTNQEKTSVLSGSESEITAKNVFSSDEVWEIISDYFEAPEKDLYVAEKFVDDKGTLLFMRLGLIGDPFRQYEYVLAGKYKNNKKDTEPGTFKTSSLETGIDELVLNESIGIYIPKRGFRYKEEENSWKEEVFAGPPK